MSIKFLDILTDTISQFIPSISISGTELSFSTKPSSIDDRIKKIELAKQNLLEGLSAIEQLQKEAENNRQEVQQALKKLGELEANKTSLLEEVQSIKEVINSDVSAFQKIARIPDEKQIRRERFIGFVSGIVSSIIATALIWGFFQMFT